MTHALPTRPPVSGCCSTPRRSSAPSPASPTRSSRATATSSEVALVGIHTRGVPLAQRLRRLIEEFAGAEVALGTLDITFYRDDVHVRGREAPLHPQPRRARDAARLPARGQDLRPRRRRPLHRPHDPRRDRGAVRLRPPARASSSPCSSTAATASCRSAPTTSARTCRRARGERVQVQLVEVDEVDQVLLVPAPEEASR